MDPEVTRESAQQLSFRQTSGKIALVLGAGNVSALVPADFLHKLFVEGSVVLLKPNPVNAYLVPLIEQAFGALIRRGYLRIVQGGAAEGAYLCQHELHMTGSDLQARTAIKFLRRFKITILFSITPVHRIMIYGCFNKGILGSCASAVWRV